VPGHKVREVTLPQSPWRPIGGVPDRRTADATWGLSKGGAKGLGPETIPGSTGGLAPRERTPGIMPVLV